MTQLGTRQAFPAAELDRRFYAYAVDRLLAWSVYAAAAFAAYRWLIEPGSTAAGVAVIAGVVLLVGLGFAMLMGVAGVSPGKRMVGLRVVRETDGRPIGVPAAVLRTLVLGVAALPTFGLGVATLAWTAVTDPTGRRRGAHDRLTGGVVVDVRPQPQLRPDAVPDERPRQIVNLTAMRLMPVPAVPPADVPAPAPVPATTFGRHIAPPPASPPPAAPPPAAPLPERPVPDHPPPPPEAAPGGPVSTQRRTAAPRATWRVTFDTGETFVVEGLALVGRRPEPRGGEPVHHLVPLRSADMSLSKTHAQFQVVPDGTLVVMDRGSTNGSVVVRRGVTRPLTAGRPSTLLDGDTVRFGDRSMQVSREG